MTEVEIKANYKAQHDTLSEAFYAKKRTIGVTPEEQAQFDQEHGQIWDGMRTELIAEGYLIIPNPPRDLATEIDDLKTRLIALEPKEM